MLGMRRRHFCLPSCSFTQGQVKLTNRIVEKRKVSSRKRKNVEYRRTEGGPQNTLASFRLQDFLCFKMFQRRAVLLLLGLPPSVNSKETPTPKQEVQPEDIEMIGRPVQESCCVKTRPWPSSDKQSHNHPGAVDTLGTNSKPVFAHDEGLAVCEMTEDAEGVEEGKMEKKAEEKVAEAKLGVLCSLEGMPGSCLSQEAAPQSPTMAEHKPRLDGSTAEGHIKVTDRIAGQKKVFRKRQKAKPKMQTAEAAGTEGGPRNTRAPFRLQDFMCFKISKRTVLFLLMLLVSTVYSSETPKPAMCAVCLENDCAIGVRRIYPAGGNTAVWVKANSPTGIQNCSMENLKADAPCKMANGSLVQLADNPLYFEGIDTYDVRGTFKSQISPCADLNLPFKPSLAPIHDTSNPAAPNNSVADNKGIIIGSVIGIIIIFIISIGVLIWRLLGHCNDSPV